MFQEQHTKPENICFKFSETYKQLLFIAAAAAQINYFI